MFLFLSSLLFIHLEWVTILIIYYLCYCCVVQSLSQVWLFVTLWAAAWASQVALVVKNLPANAGDMRDLGPVPGLGRSPGEGNGNPLQCSCLENPTEESGVATVRGVTRVPHSYTTFTSAFFMVQLSHLSMTKGISIALTVWIFVSKWCLYFLIHCLGMS